MAATLYSGASLRFDGSEKHKVQNWEKHALYKYRFVWYFYNGTFADWNHIVYILQIKPIVKRSDIFPLMLHLDEKTGNRDFKGRNSRGKWKKNGAAILCLSIEQTFHLDITISWGSYHLVLFENGAAMLCSLQMTLALASFTPTAAANGWWFSSAFSPLYTQYSLQCIV